MPQDSLKQRNTDATEKGLNILKNEQIEQISMADLAYVRVRKKILSLEFLPGQIISDFKLREELEMSRTPIKEALMRLKSDGLILDLGKKGYEVRRITEEDIIDLFDARAGIECTALKISMEKDIPEKVLKNLNRLNDDVSSADAAGDYEGVFDYDSQLHEALIETSGNTRLIEYYRMILLQLRRMRLLTYFEKSLPSEAAREHAQLFDAVEKGEKSEAIEILNRHILGTKQNYVNILRESVHSDVDFVALRYLIQNNLKITGGNCGKHMDEEEKETKI